MSQKVNRVAVVDGLRTPFVKAGTKYSDLTFQELGAIVVKELAGRAKISPSEIDELIFGTVLLDPSTPNWAREILFKAGLPKSIPAHSVSNNCISGLLAIANATDRIALGRTNCAIAGGSESMSNPSLTFAKNKASLFLKLSRARTFGERISILAQNPFQLFPKAPSVAEPSTGLTMGEHMEITAKEMGIAREAQDEVAYKSHANAAKAAESGIFDQELVPVLNVKKDLIVRSDTSVEKLSKLKAVFDRSQAGTITAGNASPLTDGASAVMLMSEEKAKSSGTDVKAYISDYEFSAIDANDGLLMAPAVCVPRLLERNGLKLEDFDLIEIHEAFAAQVLANVKAWEEGWREKPCGKIDWNKVNVLGGSIAIGHPFAATGGRIVTTLANQMKRQNAKRGLISICAAGAMAGAFILEG